MTVSAFVTTLAAKGVEIWAEGERLRVRGPQGALSADLMASLKTRKEELLAFLAANPGGNAGLPLTQAQLPIWNAYRALPNTASYHVNGTLALRSNIDLARFEQALAHVVANQPSLRCRFRTGEDGLPAQFVDSTATVPLERIQCSTNAAQAESELSAWIDRPFQLAEDLPVRFALLEDSLAERRFVFVIHHIAIDFYAAGVLLAEIDAAYQALGSGTTPKRSVGLTLREWIEQERELLAAPDIEQQFAQLGTWLNDDDAKLSLGDDFDAGGARTQSGETITKALDSSLCAGIRNLAKQAKVTPYVLMLTMFSALLGRLTRKDRLRLGIPTSGRDRPGCESLLANLVNLMPFVAELNPASDLFANLERQRRRVSEVLGLQHLPYEAQVQRFARRREAGHTPFFDVVFNWNKVAGGLGSESVFAAYLQGSSTGRHGATHHLALSVVEQGESLRCLWTFDPARFDRQRIEAFAVMFEQLLTTWIAKPNAPLWAQGLLPEPLPAAVQQLCLGEVIPSGIRNVLEAVEINAELRPKAIALRDGDRDVSYGELVHQAKRWAAVIRAEGVGADDIVLLPMGRGHQFIIACLAVWTAGAAFAPLSPDWSMARLHAVLADSRARLAIVDSVASEPALGLAKAGVSVFDPARLDAFATSLKNQPCAQALLADQLAYIIFTSGSTGKPKGVMISHRALASYVGWQIRQADLDAETITLQSGSITFDASIIEIWPALAAGGRVVVVPAEVASVPASLPQYAATQDVTWAFVITPVLEAIPAASWQQVRSLKALATGGDRLRTRPALSVTLSNLYGPTEATVLATCGDVSPTGIGLPDLGHAIDRAQVYVIDAEGWPLPAGATGEIQIASEGLARGYLGDPRRTAEAFRPNPLGGTPGARIYHSGDLARYRMDGRLQFLGRADRQLKLRGFRIEPVEIEALMLQQSGVVSARVLLSGDEQHLLAFYVGSANPESLQTVLRQQLPSYLQPSALVALKEMPRNAAGKIDDQALLGLSGPIANRPLMAPRTPTETALLAVWQSVLGRDDLSIDDDFFQAGGHSLTAAQVIERVRRDLGRDLSMAALLSAATVESLAAQMDAEDTTSLRVNESPILQSNVNDRHAPFPLTDVQHAYWAGRAASFELGNTATHIYTEQTLSSFDVDEVNRIWNVLIARHDMLRAVISVDGMQRVLADVPSYRIDVEDLRGLNAADAEARLMATRNRMSHQVFDPQHWPMFEIRVSRIADQQYRLHTSIDALIADARSFGLLEAEYDLIAQGRMHELPSLRVSFRDYVLAERESRSGQQYDAAKAYWTDRLTRFPGPPQLPFARDPSEITKPQFARRESVVASHAWQRLRDRARALRVTPSALLLTAYAEVLGRFSTEPRFGLNLTLFNRQPWHPDVEHLVGDFTSLTLLEVETADAADFASRAVRCQNQLWRDLEHRSFSGVEVLRELTRLQQGRAAGMPVVFTSILPLDGDSQGAATSVPDYAITQTSQVWIDHVVEERHGALHFHWDAVEALFPAGLLDDLFASYEQLLHDLANDDATWSQACPTKLPAHQQLARGDYNSTIAPIPAGKLYEPILVQAAASPEAVAVIDSRRTLTYRELRNEAVRLSQRLSELGVGRNQLVAIEMRKGWEQVVGALAVTLAGGAYLPIDASLPAARRAQVLEQGRVQVSLVQADAPTESLAGVVRVTVTPYAVDGDLPFIAPPDLLDTDLAYVIFTSGSTGVPKGVMIDHRGALNTIVDVNQRFQIDARDRSLGLSSLSFDLSVYDIFGLLAAGGALVLPSDDEIRDPQRWAPLLSQHRVTLINAVPSFVQMLLDYLDTGAIADVSSLRLVMMSGDWIPLALPERLRAKVAGLRVTSLGGATEASIWSILHDIDQVDPSWRSIPYGRPMLNQHMHVLNRQGEPCPEWVAGDLYIGGIGLAQGYWGDQAKTAAAFIQHPVTGERLYRTGDLGRFRPGGWIEFLGRVDNQVKVQGHRIELAEIEAHLGEHPAVREVAVAVKGDGPGRGLFAYVVPALSKVREQAADAARSAVDFTTETSASGETGFELVEDPIDRLLFKFARHGLRRLPADTPRIGLAEQAGIELDFAPVARASSESVAASQLAGILSAARAINQPGAPLPKYFYPSAGSLYPVQVYVRIGGGCELPAGHYYYEPSRHELVRVSDTPAEADFALILVGDLAAIAPLYGSLAKPFCALESGYLAQLLRASATSAGLGLVGSVLPDSVLESLRRALHLGRGQVPLVQLEPGQAVSGDVATVPDDAIRLPARSMSDRFQLSPLDRQSYREYSGRALSLGELADVLDRKADAVCRQWVYVKRDAVAGLDAGLYQLDPSGRALLPMQDAADELLRDAYSGDNQALFDQCGIAVFFTAHQSSVPAMFAAGAVSSALMVRGARATVGFCAIGHVREVKLHAALPVLRNFVLLHSLVGGAITVAQKTRWQTVSKPNAEHALSRQLDEHIRQRLPDYMAPRGYIVLDAMPLNANNKVDRSALPAPGQDLQVARDFEAPQGALEQQIADIWRELLGLDRIGRQDNFFALGGNSVLIVQMFGKISAQVAGELNVADLFTHVTIADLARHLGQMSAVQPEVATDLVSARAAKRREAMGRGRSRAEMEEAT